MRISDWSSDVCSSDLLKAVGCEKSGRDHQFGYCGLERVHRFWRPGQEFCDIRVQPHWCRSEEHTSELQSLMRNSYAVFCLKKKNNTTIIDSDEITEYEIIHTIYMKRDEYKKR